jgi:hypothetical protein
VTHGPERVEVAVAAGFGAHAELALLLGRADPRLARLGSEARVYPAGEVGAAGPAARIVRLAIAAGQQQALARAAGAARRGAVRYLVSATPQPARSGQPVQLRVRALDPRSEPARGVAWRLDPLQTAFGAAALEQRFVALGEHRVAVLVLQQDGSAVAAEGKVRVQTARASGCAAAARAPSASWLLVWPALLLRKRRQRDRSGIDSRAGSVPKGLSS